MATGLIPDLDDAVYGRLDARAAGHSRALEAELRAILVLASRQVDMAAADEMRRVMEGCRCSESKESLVQGCFR